MWRNVELPELLVYWANQLKLTADYGAKYAVGKVVYTHA